MLLLPILLSILLFSPCSTTFEENEPTFEQSIYTFAAEFVDKAAVDALSTEGTASADFLLDLNVLGTQAARLMQAVIPNGANVVMTEPQSEEYKALMDLSNRTEEIWRHIESRTKISKRGIGARIPRNLDYFEIVQLPIKVMKVLTDQYLNPKMFKSDEDINIYKSACKFGDNDPRRILERMRLQLVEYCYDAVTPTEAETLADHRAYLMRVLLRLRVVGEPIPDPGLYLPEFLAIYRRIRKSVLNEDLDVFNRYFSSYRKAVQAFFDELRDRASIGKVENDEDACLLRALIHTSYFNYPTIKTFALELKNDLIVVTFIAGICANVVNGDAQSIDRYTEGIIDDVTLISSFASKWLNDSLISAWPSAHNQILKEQIQRIVPKPGHVDDRLLKTVAELSHPLLINTGLPNHVYEMLIVRAVQKEYELYFEGMSNYCSLNKGAFGFDTVIGRIPLDSTNEQDTFEVAARMLRLRTDADDLNFTIQHEMNELYDAAHLPLIADTLKKKVVYEFITQQDFHCWGIVREWSPQFWNACPTIDYWSSSYESNNLSSITTLSYMNRGTLFQDCEEFRFFFLA